MSPRRSAAGSRQPGALGTLGLRLAGHSSIYVLGGVLSAMYGLVQVAVLTRILPVAGFGQLAVLIFYSGLITTLCNLFFVTGTMVSLPFATGGGGGGDMDEDGDGDVVEDPKPGRRGIEPQKLLGTGMTIALVLTVVVTGLSLALAQPLARLVLGESGSGAAIVWATAAGALGSVWRMVTSVPRYERRPGRYVALQAGYWAISLGAAAALAANGRGVAGAMAGIAIGHAVAGAVGLWFARHRLRPAMQRSAVGQLGRRGAPYASITLPGFVARHADLYVLSLYVPHRELALYTVATRFSRIPSLAAGSAVLAFGPLVRAGPMRAALERDNAADFARERIVSYYVMLATWNVVALAIWAHELVAIVPKGYADAALLIQLFALVAAVHGAQGVLYRMSRFPRKIYRLRQMVCVSAVLTVGGALLLTPPYGVYGAVVSAALGPAFGVPFLIVLGLRGGTPLPLSAARFIRCFGLGIACLAMAYAARPLPHGPEIVASLLITLAFPVLLVVTEVMPRTEVVRLFGLVRGLWAPRSERARLRAAMATLAKADLDFLHALAIRREDPNDVAARLGQRGGDIRRRFVELLRSLGPGGEASDADDQIADFLLSPLHVTERDGIALSLASRGHADPLELDRLATVLERLRQLPNAAWAQDEAAASARAVPPGLAEAEPPAAL